MLMINTFSLLFTLIGLYGVLYIHTICIGTHAVLTTAIIGGFCLYTVLEIIVMMTLEVTNNHFFI